MRISSVFVILAAVTGVACSSTTTGTSGGTPGTSGGTSGTSGSTPVSASACSSRCQTKATSCGEPAADAMTSCSSLCSSTTESQLSCLEAKACSELSASNFETLCPKDTGSSGTTSGGTSGTTGGTKALGDACTCAGVSAGADGFCSGTSQQCMSNLKCIYGAGSNGSGNCYAESCCDMTSACENDSSLLKACSSGTCKATPVGFYCGR